MAGKRHHIIPKFLQKGFASRFDKDEVFVWVYRKDKKPFENNVKNVTVENNFYGKEKEATNADDAITLAESKSFSPLIDKLRNESGNVTTLKTEISELVAHIAIRTKQLRNSFVETVDYLTDELDNYLSDFGKVKNLLINNPKLVEGELGKVLDTIDAPEELKSLLFPLVKNLLPNLLDEEKKNFERMSSELFQQLKPIIPDAAKQGHNKAIINNTVPKNRAKNYANLKWHVCNSKSPIILGDIGCLFETSGRRFVPIDDLISEPINIFLPISSKKILVGTRYSNVPEVNSKDINKYIARCSYELFICSENSNKYSQLAKIIGTWSGVFNAREKNKGWEYIRKDLEKLDGLSEKDE